MSGPGEDDELAIVRFAKLVRTMRSAQGQYFKKRTPVLLEQSRELERRVDKACAYVIGKHAAAQRQLFEAEEEPPPAQGAYGPRGPEAPRGPPAASAAGGSCGGPGPGAREGVRRRGPRRSGRADGPRRLGRSPRPGAGGLGG